MTQGTTVGGIARYRQEARRCRRLSLRIEPSVAKLALERLARRWELMARAEDAARAASDARARAGLL